MRAGSYQPLAKRKGVYRECAFFEGEESEGSVMSKVPARGIRIILGIQSGMSLLIKTKFNKLHGHEDVNMAGMWDEGYAPYRKVSRTGGNRV